MGAGEATRQLRRHTVLPEGPSWTLNTQVRQLPTVSTFSSRAPIASDLRGQLYSHAHTHSSTHVHSITNNISFAQRGKSGINQLNKMGKELTTSIVQSKETSIHKLISTGIYTI